MINKRNFNTWIAVGALTLLAPAAHAQFGGLLGKKDSGGGAAAAPGADLVTQQTQLGKSYVAANKDVLLANSAMAEAVGLKDAAAASRATADALTEGATKGSLESADKELSASTDAVAQELNKAPKLDAKAKKRFAAGLSSLAQGTLKYIGMRKPVETFGNGLGSASPMELPKLQAGTYMVKSFPGNLKNVSSALSTAVAFAKSNDIPVPKDATQAMAAL